MSYDKTSAEIDALLFACDISKEDLEKVSIVVPKPSSSEERKRGRPKGSRVNSSGTLVQKYIDFTGYPSKEAKMEFVLNHIIRATSFEFVKTMKESNWITISYSRPYKESIGGPIFLVGEISDDASSKSVKKGRDRFGEINNRFPLYALTVKLSVKFNTWMRSRVVDEVPSHIEEDEPSMDDMEEIDLEID